jgi:hypothetical protein
MKLTHKFAEMTPEKRPQDPNMDGTGLRFETMEHGWEYPDTMPQAIKLIDAEGRSCIYVPTLKTERSSTAKDMCSIWKTNDVCFRERYRHQIPRTSRRILALFGRDRRVGECPLLREERKSELLGTISVFGG